MTLNIKNLTGRQLLDWLDSQGEPKFRAKQIHEWLYDHFVQDFQAMRNLPLKLREQLARDFSATSVSAVKEQSAEDGTVKYLLELADNKTVETVLIPQGERYTVCVSSQVGCPVGCYFCASGQDGLERNLSIAEIVDQVLFCCARLGRKVDNVVVMGIGEPLLNTENLIPALNVLTDPASLNLGARRLTVSTSGIVPGMKKLADEGKQWNLALSLHAASDSRRSRFIPNRFRYPLHDIFAACRYYHQQTGRMVYFEYTLIKDANDAETDAEELAAHARKVKAKVNLIPCNPSFNNAWQPPSQDVIEAFQNTLAAKGVSSTLRQRKGCDIQAACGQLRSHSLNAIEV
ncbi:MAG: 23S rRNA (adenine(2503)-C(2))-methyltransferase RlmN [Verrucomicrobiota bacterium]